MHSVWSVISPSVKNTDHGYNHNDETNIDCKRSKIVYSFYLFGLSQEEEHRLGFMCGRADENHSSLWVIKVISPSGNRAADVMLVSQILVGEIVLRADQHSRRSIVSTGNGYEKVGMLL